jgi:protein-tyrosine phosphatase
MNPQAVDALTALGYNSTTHSSTLISVEAVEEADVILTFTQGQKIEMAERFPAAIEKVFTISEYANRGSGISVDVSDPYGRSPEVYKETAETIASLVELIVGSLKAS